MTDRPTRISQPTVRLVEVVVALATVPAGRRRVLFAVLMRLGADRGWSEEIRGFAHVLAAMLDGLAGGEDLRDLLDHIDALDVTDGSLAWAVKEVPDG